MDMVMDNLNIAISIGNDCSVAYNIRKLNYANVAFPFDWMKLQNLKSVIEIIKNDFAGFCDLDQYEILPQYTNFAYNDQEDELIDVVNITEIPSITSRCKLVHKKYGFILPHEFNGDYLDKEKFIEKYNRRIARFRKYVKDSRYEVRFIRLGIFKDKNYIDELTEILENYCKHDNFVIYNINESLYELPKTENFIWTREYIPWDKILAL
jgi:hypothetical protein